MRRRWENRITRIEVLFIRPAEAVRHIPVKEEDLSRKRPCSRLRIRRFSLRASTVKIRSLDAGLFLTHVDVDHEVSGNKKERRLVAAALGVPVTKVTSPCAWLSESR